MSLTGWGNPNSKGYFCTSTAWHSTGESDHICDRHVDEQVAGANLYPGVLDCPHLPSFRKLLVFYQIPRAVCPEHGHHWLSFSAKIIYLHFSQNVLSVAFLPNFIYSCLVRVTWFQEKKKKNKKNLSMLKFWVPSFQLECTSSVRPAAEKRRNQFAHSHEPHLWKTDSAGGRLAVSVHPGPKTLLSASRAKTLLSASRAKPSASYATLHTHACFCF